MTLVQESSGYTLDPALGIVYDISRITLIENETCKCLSGYKR